MNPNTDVYFIKESRIYPMKTKIIVLGTLLLGLCIFGFGGWLYLTQQPERHTDAGYGLDAEQLADVTPYGELHVSTMVDSEEGSELQTLQYSFLDDWYFRQSRDIYSESVQIGDYRAFVHLNSSTSIAATKDATVMLENTKSGETREISTADQYGESFVALSSQGNYVAYSFQSSEATPDQNVLHSSLEVFNMISGENSVIVAATKPVFFKDGTGLLYLGVNGIYEFDLAAKTSQLVYATTPNLQLTDDYAVSADSQYLVMTFAQYGTISVAQNTGDNTTNFTEIGALVTPGVTYFNPVIATDGRMYAVQTRSNLGTPAQFEVRSLRNETVLKTISLPELGQNSRLQSWRVTGHRMVPDSPEILETLNNPIQ